ncbi:MAG: hypothetical protein AB1324_00590 [Candidatus Micrarchaeota archaeon]
MISKDEILRRGYVDVKVYVQGLRQSHRMAVVREKTSAGIVPFLESKFYIPTMELVRLAEELQLPVKHKDVRVFPKGKMAGHFAEKAKPAAGDATVVPETVEAEVEE